ncbi:MAG: hypothetical protein ACXWC7_00110 [Chitinophagaceae bacterium]
MALLTGISLLDMAVVAGFGYGYAFESLYVANDKAVTLSNLQAIQPCLIAVQQSNSLHILNR